MLLSAIHLMLNLRMLLPTVAVVQPLHVIVAVTVDCHPLVISSVCGLMVQPLLLCNMSRCCQVYVVDCPLSSLVMAAVF